MRLTRLLRNRLIGFARRLRGSVAKAAPKRKRELPLSVVQRRLELILNAMYGHALSDGLMAEGPGITPQAQSVVLPRSIPETGDAAERYRLLAIEQGARVVRGTRSLTPSDPLERDLYWMIEAAAIDAGLVAAAPGLAKAIMRHRREELRRRSRFSVDPGARKVEAILKEMLSADPSSPPPSLPRTVTPEDSVAVARSLATDIRRDMKRRAFYPAIEWVPGWDYRGAGERAPEPLLQRSDTYLQPTKNATHTAESDQSDSHANETREAGTSDRDAGAPAPDDEVSFPDTKHQAVPTSAAPGGTPYPEWVERFKRVEPRYATVFDVEAEEGDGTWARNALRENAALIRQLRDRFSMLRARRLRLRAQRSGEEIDLDACVNAVVDRRMNRVPSDRLYQTTRSNRHSLAITILVDASGSTREQLADGQQVLDVERLSVVVASEALASLGDPYSILAFSGNSRHSVRVATLKAFDEHDLTPMHARVSALEPGDNTRLGAAVRHATSLLLKQSVQRHVLLILSDGKPNDVDWYWANAAIEDSRIALLEARAAGVHSFCITVDTKEADYLPHLFSAGAYWVLADPTELPKALIRLIDTILTA
jgi:nitric oxide reductase NorD protein